MSTNSLIQDLQKQSSGSSLVELFELEKYDGSFAYITPGEDSDGSSLQLYDYADNSTLRTYAPYPVTADGFDIKITGAIARPVCTFSNVGSNFTTLIGTSDIDSLLGKKFIRRLTLKKYLANEPGDTGSGVQSIEFVRQVWTIAKVTDRDSSSLIFELASPFDLQGVKIPASYTNYTTASGSTSFSVDSYIKTTGESAKRISNTGIVSAVTDIVRYWIVNTTDTKDNLGSPTDSNAKFDAVRVYETYNASTTYKAYTDDRLNEMVQYDGFIWVVKKESTGNTPGFNEYWKRGDECGKRLSSCGKRFGFNAVDKTSTTSRAKASVNSYPQLPFGGFPGSKNFE